MEGAVSDHVAFRQVSYAGRLGCLCQLVCMHVVKATVFIKTQENLAENIASFVHIFQRTEVGK